MKTVLSLNNIQKKYSNEQIFQDFSFEVYEGETLGIIGPSGCGKSTLLRMIAGLEKPDAGEITFCSAYEKPKVFMVFQSFHQLFPWMTVLENVLYPLRLDKNSPGKKELLQATGEDLLRKVEYQGDGAKYPHQLSGGMKQKVALARALALKPDILLMDEPFASLDAAMRDYMQSLLLRIKEKDPMTILFVTHDQTEAKRLSDRILVLDKNRQ